MRLRFRTVGAFVPAPFLVVLVACGPPPEQQQDLHIRYLAAGGDAGVSQDGVLRWSENPIDWPDPILWKPGDIIEGMTSAGSWYADIFDDQQQPIWPGAWYRADSGTTLDLTACAYGQSTWVAVGTVLFYSTDNGKTWTRATDVPDVVPVPLSDVIYGEDSFIAVGDQTVLYSLDGKKWQAGKTFEDDANRFWCAAYNPDAPSLTPEDIVNLR